MNNLNSNVKENKVYDFQKRLYTSYSKFTEVKLVTIGIASPLRILQWAEKTLPNGKIYGEVLNANTLHHKTFKPQKGGLFCERIFGPLKDFQCSCGKIDKTPKYSFKDTEQKNESRKSKLEETMDQKDIIEPKKSLSELTSGVTKDKTNTKTPRKLRKFCPDCDVEYTWSVIRRYQLGYIKLISPVTHVWFLKGTPSYISILLDIKKRYLQSITYCSETFTIEHSESAASALQTYKTSGFDLDSPSKIYASWLKAKKMGEEKNSEGIFSDYSDSTQNPKSLTKEKIAGTQKEPFENFSGGFSEKIVSVSSTHEGRAKNLHLELKKKRLNTIEKWKRSKDSTLRESTLKNLFNTMNKNEKLYINKTPELLNLFQMKGKNIVGINSLEFIPKEKISKKFSPREFFSRGLNSKEFNPKGLIPKELTPAQTFGLNSSELSSEFDMAKLEIRYLILQFIYVLQLGFIYNNFIQSLFSDEIFKIETYLNQKNFSEKREKFTVRRLEEENPPSDLNSHLNETTSAHEDNLKIKDFNTNKSGENSPDFENLSGEKNSEGIFSMQSPFVSVGENIENISSPSGIFSPSSEEKSKDFSSPHLIQKINKKSPIDLYIKASLQRMLHKKILLYSIVKTWQNVYKKAYLKAMYKINTYYFQTNKFGNIKGNQKFLRSQENSHLSFVGINSLEFSPPTPSNNISPELALSYYYKINKNYAHKTTVKYLKNIIQLVKSYFKQNILLTLQNIKQPIFSLHLQNTKNYTIKNLCLDDKMKMSPFLEDFNNSKVGRKSKDFFPRLFNTSNFCSTDIPIPYSTSQLINKKSDEMTNFLSLDVSSLVDLLADSGFMPPLVVGKFFEHTRHNTVGKNQRFFGPPLPSPAVFETTLSPTNGSLITINNEEKNNFKDSRFFEQTRKSDGVISVYGKKIPQELFKARSNNFNLSSKIGLFYLVKKFLKENNLKLSSKDISKLLVYRLFKQPFYDLYFINTGKYSKNNSVEKFKEYFYGIDDVLKKDTVDVNDLNTKNTQNFEGLEPQNLIHKNENTEENGKKIPEEFSQSKDVKNKEFLPEHAEAQTPKKRLYNNIYTLSHRERWGSRINEGKDWQIFLLYNSAVSNSNDQPILAYKERFSSTAFNSQNYSLSRKTMGSQGYSFNQNKERVGINSKEFIPKENFSYGILINNSFFSGPGIIQQLLNELTFTEMKKLDKQNRLLLYVLNKSIFKIKKHLKMFFYDKNSQIELRELCKKRDLLIRRTKLVRKLFRKDSDPSSMILTVLPVLPPDLRPIVKMGGQIAASDLNRFYQRVIYRNDRLKKFLKDPATSNSYEMKYAQRLLQEAVDNLIQNSQSSGEKDARGRALKSLSDILKGKQGRFRQFLLGKRVDYSGRSVIVVGPKLKLFECGVPLEMALELYLPFLLKTILNKNYAKTVVGAKALIKTNRPLCLELLREIMQVSPVLLNRAPTLHRLGFQAFVPKLVEGRAILLHPLVCSSFNADFDGDQMAVHVPITIEARAEAWKLMLSRNNMLSPATGDPLSIPSQDMVLGCYYLTTNSNKATLSFLRGSGLFFTDLYKVLYAYDLQKIDLHALVWVKWTGLIENGNDQEEPVEIRLSSLGHWQELSYNYIRHFDSSSQLIHQYMSTTPGRILFYSLLQSL